MAVSITFGKKPAAYWRGYYQRQDPETMRYTNLMCEAVMAGDLEGEKKWGAKAKEAWERYLQANPEIARKVLEEEIEDRKEMQKMFDRLAEQEKRAKADAAQQKMKTLYRQAFWQAMQKKSTE